jgi:hypothetical protein
MGVEGTAWIIGVVAAMYGVRLALVTPKARP